MSRLELANSLNVGEATISRHMKWLKDHKYVVRKGGNKVGYWKVLFIISYISHDLKQAKFIDPINKDVSKGYFV